MKNNKTQVKEGIFDAADRFVSAFFRGLERNAANQIIKKAQTAKLPKEALQLMKDIDDRAKELRELMKDL